MTFACKHFDYDQGSCCRLKAECIPGRPGCVLADGMMLSDNLQKRIAESEARPKREKS